MKNKDQQVRNNFPEVERRFVPTKMEVRMDGEEGEGEEKQPVIFGQAAKINEPYLLYKWSDGEEWWEVLAPGFFDDVLNDDVRCLKNHDSNLVLGRTKSGTCSVTADATALNYECNPDMRITYAADTVHSVERGDVDQCSFQFSVSKRSWTEEELPDGNMKVTFTLEKCKKLYDVGPVTFPANENTIVGVRSNDLEQLRKELIAERSKKIEEQTPKTNPQQQRRQRELELRQRQITL